MTFETGTGRRVAVELPDPSELEEWPQIKAAVEEHGRLARVHREAAAKLDAVVGHRTVAEQEDRAAFARALKQRKGDPGEEAVKRQAEEERSARRRFDAAGLAMEEAGRDLVAVLEEHRATALTEADALIGTDRDECIEAIERLEAARSRMLARQSLRHWLATFPEQLKYRRVTRPLGTLIDGASGEPLRFDRVMAALRADAAPTDPGEAE